MHRTKIKGREKSEDKNRYEKGFFIRCAVCLLILLISYFVSESNSAVFDGAKSYIANVLEESTDIKKTGKQISDTYMKIMTKFGKETVPVDKFTGDKAPLASNNEHDLLILNAKATGSESETFENGGKTDETGSANNSGGENVNIGNASGEISKKDEPFKFRSPAKGIVSSPYGMRTHPVTGGEKVHNGIDIAGAKGETVISAAPGVILKTGRDEFNGNYVFVDHKNGFQTSYAHLDKVFVIKGEEVDSNTKIGEMGDTGLATGVNLHFEIKFKGEKVNPEDYVTVER